MTPDEREISRMSFELVATRNERDKAEARVRELEQFAHEKSQRIAELEGEMAKWKRQVVLEEDKRGQTMKRKRMTLEERAVETLVDTSGLCTTDKDIRAGLIRMWISGYRAAQRDARRTAGTWRKCKCCGRTFRTKKNVFCYDCEC